MNELVWRLQPFAAGVIGVVADADEVKRIILRVHATEVMETIDGQFPAARSVGGHPLLDAAFDQFGRYFSGQLHDFVLPLAAAGLSVFARRVHAELVQVTYGEVISYGQLASRCAVPGAARAVGNVMAGNPFPLVVPCHRVVGTGGRLGGYSGGQGIETKRWLLDFEKRHSTV